MATFRYYHLEWWLLPIEDMCDALLPAVLWCEMMEKNIEYSSMGGKKVKQKIRSHRQTWMCDMHAWLSVQVSVCAVCLLEEREENIHSFCWNLVEIPKFFFSIYLFHAQSCDSCWLLNLHSFQMFLPMCSVQCGGVQCARGKQLSWRFFGLHQTLWDFRHFIADFARLSQTFEISETFWDFSRHFQSRRRPLRSRVRSDCVFGSVPGYGSDSGFVFGSGSGSVSGSK